MLGGEEVLATSTRIWGLSNFALFLGCMCSTLACADMGSGVTRVAPSTPSGQPSERGENAEAARQGPVDGEAGDGETLAGELNSESAAPLASVLSVATTGQAGSYTFSVTVRSPDSGCSAFADFWEVLDASGELLYRRVLLHSHVSEQPFTRSGGLVPAQPSQMLLVRAHFASEDSGNGLGGQELVGSVESGFEPRPGRPDYFLDVLQQQPRPRGCAF